MSKTENLASKAYNLIIKNQSLIDKRAVKTIKNFVDVAMITRDTEKKIQLFNKTFNAWLVSRQIEENPKQLNVSRFKSMMTQQAKNLKMQKTAEKLLEDHEQKLKSIDEHITGISKHIDDNTKYYEKVVEFNSIKKKATALHGAVEAYTIKPSHTMAVVSDWFMKYYKHIKSKVQNLITIKKALKLRFAFNILMSKEEYGFDNEIIIVKDNFWFNTFATELIRMDQLQQLCQEAQAKIEKDIQNMKDKSSKWKVEKIICVEVYFAELKPLNAKSYIELPEVLKRKMALLNIDNEDDQCFKWCIYAHLYPIDSKNHPNRVSHYEKIERELADDKKLNFTGINFPLAVKDIPKFEQLNTLSVNVLEYSNNEINPMYKSKGEYETEINLLMISDETKNHYVLVRNLSRLLSSSVSNHNGSAHFCMNCLSGFPTIEKLKDHKKLCYKHEICKAVLPSKDDAHVEFHNVKKMIRAPFAIYADFESVLIPVEKEEEDDKDNDGEPQKVKIYQTHKACSFAYLIVSDYEQYNGKFELYRGMDAADVFCKKILDERDRLMKIVRNNTKMTKLTNEEQISYDMATECHICCKKLNNDKVCDHDHITGKYRGPAHNDCNLNFNLKYFNIPVFFHNLKNYDSHLIIQALGKYTSNIDVIPTTEERYISFKVQNMVFLDSFAFMASSIESLSINLGSENLDKFKMTKKMFAELNEEKLRLITQKGVYPYDYFDSIDRFNETQLPDKKCFYSQLYKCDISDDDYIHAQKVWHEFNIHNLGEYHDIYLKTDVCLLADIFEEFRNVCYNNFKLDPCHYYTAPGLAWDAALKKYDKSIELIDNQNNEMYLMVEEGIRGGISFIANRYFEANNKYMKSYKPDEPNKHILYLDCNNLYGWAMYQKLPCGEYRLEDGSKWMKNDKPDMNRIMAISNENDYGAIFEVDLEYPKNVHDLHNDYPLAPESVLVEEEMLSEYQKKLVNNLKIKDAKVPKLCPNLMNKHKYVLHYRNLKLYLDLGMKLTKIHRAIVFKQDYVLKDYVEANTKNRSKATNDFEKDFWKLMNNAVFGKTMENVRNRINFKLVSDKTKFLKKVAKHNFERETIFNENLVGCHMRKTKVDLNKPIIVGMAILELSKVIMYDFYYNTMKKRYGDKMKLLFTDTDSLCMGIETYDIYEDMKDFQDLLDTSNYDKNHMLFSKTNNKVVGKFKDEAGGHQITEFVGLRSKLYSFQLDGKDKKRCKGVPRNTVQHEISHAHYKEVLFEEKQMQAKFNNIVSRQHQLYTVHITKNALSCFDDKRYLWNATDSFAYGNYHIEEH